MVDEHALKAADELANKVDSVNQRAALCTPRQSQQFGSAALAGSPAKAGGVTPKVVRHNKSSGLLPAINRTDSGYRQYSPRDLHVLRFIRHSRDLGFSLDQIRELLGLWQDRSRPSREVKALAQAHSDELDKKPRELQAMRNTLKSLVGCCHGDERPDCPIIESLAGHEDAGQSSHLHGQRRALLLPAASSAAKANRRSSSSSRWLLRWRSKGTPWCDRWSTRWPGAASAARPG